MSRPERTCAMCGDPIPTGRPRVELRIQAVEPQCDETVGNWTHETHHGLAAAQLCEECGAYVTDRSVAILNSTAGGALTRPATARPSGCSRRPSQPWPHGGR